MTDGPYSRLYHRFAKEFRAVYDDDRAFAAWARLLMLADASWPMRPPLPRSVRPAIVRQLVAAKVLILDGDDYTVLGLDAERERRRESGRIGAAKRWQSDGNANASAMAMPSTDETRTSRDKREIPPPPAERGRRENRTNPRATGEAPRLNGTNGRANGTSPRQVRKAQKTGRVPGLGAMLRHADELGRSGADA